MLPERTSLQELPAVGLPRLEEPGTPSKHNRYQYTGTSGVVKADLQAIGDLARNCRDGGVKLPTV